MERYIFNAYGETADKLIKFFNLQQCGDFNTAKVTMSVTKVYASGRSKVEVEVDL